MMQIEAETTEVEQTPVAQADEITDANDLPDGETPAAQGDEATGDDDGQVFVSIGEESPPSEEDEQKAAPQWLKELRKNDREKTRRIRELEDQVKATTAPAKAQPVAKPTLESCDYDEEEFERRFTAYQAAQAEQAAEQRAKDAEAQAATDAWNARVEAHNKAKAALRVPDYDDVEATVSEAFSITQRGIIVSGAENSALVTYAVGNNPAKLKELAAIKDPVKFAFAVAKLETQLKVTPRKAPPAPEKRLAGSAPVQGSGNSELTRLEADADRTGDRSKLIAYKKSQKQAA